MDLIITILPVATKDLPISPRFTPYNFLSRCKFSTLTTRQPMVEFYLLTFPRFPLRKKEHKSYFGKNRTYDFHLSLRNLVSGYEYGRVFPAGVGPGSPSRDAANWLLSRFGLRQYGWLGMVFSGVRLFRAPIWWPSGGWRHARGREHCRREPGSSLSGGYAPDSAKAEGSSIVDEPGEGWTPVRENRKQREPGGFWGKSWSLTAVVFLPTRATWSGERARFVGFFKDAQGFGRLDAGSCAGFTSSRPPPPWTSVFQFSLFLYDVGPWETWNCWSKLVGTYLSDLLLRTLVVGRRQQSESIEAALDMV